MDLPEAEQKFVSKFITEFRNILFVYFFFYLIFFNIFLFYSLTPEGCDIILSFIVFSPLLAEKSDVFVYSQNGNFFKYSSIRECSKALGISRTTIQRALKEAQPYKNYYFSLCSVEPKYLYDIGFHSREAINECKALVLWGSQDFLVSSIGFSMFSPKISNLIQIPPYIEGILIGLLLSDAWVSFASATSKNARIGFKQGMINFPYFWHVFILLSHYCSSYPQLTSSVRNNKRSFGLQLQTRSLPCFTQFHYLFYINGVKIVPKDIYNLLTPIALAHWIMGDGGFRKHGLILSTNSFSIQETVCLINVLIIRYNLDCTLRLEYNKSLIYIRSSSLSLLKSIVLPYMHSSMYYKIHL
jgi:hypothetical protein